MRFDFSDFTFNDRAFFDRPMTFARPEVTRFLTALFELTALETGPKAARMAWQAAQTANLLRHATERSPFWRNQIEAAKTLANLPILRRADVREQVSREGALLAPADRIAVKKHVTSGSSGEPVAFLVSEMNGNYNALRSIAQYFLEDRDLTLNRVRVKSVAKPVDNGVSVENEGSWLGALAPFVIAGENRVIKLLHHDAGLMWTELRKAPIGYLSIAPSALEALLQRVEPKELKQAGLAMLVLLAEPLDPEVRQRFAEVGVPARETYSCEEVGPIAFECDRRPGHFHVATSNVIVEAVGDGGVTVDNAPLGNVLITHLHSYATPFIRYEVGDLATVSERCPCGHDGPTLANIVGRTKGLLKHPDGRLLRLHIRGSDMIAIAPLEEYRVRQTGPATIVIEIGGRKSLTQAEKTAFADVVRTRAGEGFSIEVRAVEKIDWGHSLKRLGFHNEIL